MQIYPGKHQLTTVQKVDLSSEIPLAYIDKEFQDYGIEIIAAKKGNGIKKVLPYQKFDTQAIKLFKPLSSETNDSKDYVEVSSDERFDIIQRIDDKYQYMPKAATVFNPQEFVYSSVIKKNIEYNTRTIYNIKAACDDDAKMSFSKKLIKLFGDAPDRGICPSNIWVNNKDISTYSLTNHSMENVDFVFLESKDGIYYKDEDIVIDVKSYLNKRVNVWMTIQTPSFEVQKNQTSKMKNNSLYKDVIVDNNLFLLNSIHAEDADYIVHNVFEGSYGAAAIIEYPKRGFVIKTTEDFIANVEKNVKAFYEILFYVYKQTYLESEKTREWITDIPMDYVVVNNELTISNIFTSKKRIYEYFGLTPKEVTLVDVLIDQPNVKHTDVINDYLVFKKSTDGEFSKYADPVKPNGYISVFTSRRNVMYFNEFVYTIEDDVAEKIEIEKTEREYVLSIGNFKHTFLEINFTDFPVHEISIPLTITENYQEIPIELSTFAIYKEGNFLSIANVDKQTIHGTIIAYVKIFKTKQETQVYDMRRRGGGLPEGEPDDYSLLDIGHIFGLAYRKAGAVVVTLPERLRPHKELIEEVLNKHIVSEKIPIILFREEDDNEK